MCYWKPAVLLFAILQFAPLAVANGAGVEETANARAYEAAKEARTQGTSEVQQRVQEWSSKVVVELSAFLLIFAVIVLLLMFILIKADKPPEQILRVFGTLIIIIVAVVLAVAGFGDRQIAPVMGLLGTVAGYLLGKTPIAEAKRDSTGVPVPSGMNTPSEVIK